MHKYMLISTNKHIFFLNQHPFFYINLYPVAYQTKKSKNQFLLSDESCKCVVHKNHNMAHFAKIDIDAIYKLSLLLFCGWFKNKNSILKAPENLSAR